MPSTNGSYGTYVSDGLRTGPLFPGSTTPNPATNAIYSNPNLKFGPGVLQANNYMYTITPYATAPGNVVATMTPGGAGPLPLNSAGLVQNSCVTYLVDPQSQQAYIQFDWPRTLSVTTGAGIAANTNITFFGYDYWGWPMQASILNLSSSATANVFKAFSYITQVYISQAPGTTITVQAANAFGLPYVLNDVGAVYCFGWNGTSYLTFGGGTTPSVNPPPANILIGAADTNVPSPTTRDVRGLAVAPSAPDAVKKLYFGYYVEGNDVWFDQQNDFYRAQAQALNTPYPGVWEAGLDISGNRLPIQPLTDQGLYGLPQYYTGVPA